MDRKKETTLRCVLTLTVIAVVCGLLLSVLSQVLAVEPDPKVFNTNFGQASEFKVQTLDADLAKAVKGGKVVLVGRYTEQETDVIGINIKTNSEGQLGECEYVMYIDVKTDKLYKAVMTKDGSTAGRSYANYGDKGANFEDYLITIDSENPYKDFVYPGLNGVNKVGATKTLKAVNNAFIIASHYYYNYYVAGDGKTIPTEVEGGSK